FFNRPAPHDLYPLSLHDALPILDAETRAANGLVTAFVLYNFGAAVLLAFASIGLRLSGLCLWPAVLLHAVMGAWCVARLLKRRLDRKSTRLNSSHQIISYAVFCL